MKSRLLSRFLLVLAAVGLAGLLQQVGTLRGYDRRLSDLWHTLGGVRGAPQHVALVMIDEATFAAHRDEPIVTWGPYFAQAIEVIRAAGAKLVVVDMHFGTSVEEWFTRMELEDEVGQTWDLPLRTQLAEGNVILAAAAEDAGDDMLQIVLPTPSYLYSLPGVTSDLGLANLLPQADGVVRTFSIAPLGTESEPALTLGPLAAVRATDQAQDQETFTFGSQTFAANADEYPIGWLGPPGTFPMLSMQALLAEDALELPEVQALKDRIVLIGSDYFGFHDIHLTPYASSWFGGTRQMMSGPEIQANIIETLLSERLPRTAPIWVSLMLALAWCFIALWLLERRPPWVGLGVVLLSALLTAGLAWAAFQQGVTLHVGVVHLSLASGFVMNVSLRLTGERRRRQQLVDAVGKYVSEDVVDILVKSGRTPNLGGESVQITVMFMDIRNFTTISERLEVQEVIAMLNAFLERAVAPVLDNGGTVDKFLGDGMMAIFGSPVPYADHALRALRAAEGIEREANAFRSWFAKNLGDREIPEFAIGIGLHTGTAVTGNVGSTRRMEFTAIGDSVNTASRVEGLTKRLGVNVAVTEAVVEASGVASECFGEPQDMMVKGRAEAVRVREFRGGLL